MAGAMDSIGNVTEAVGIIHITRETIGDSNHHQVTTGLNESDGSESTTMSVCGRGTQTPVSSVSGQTPGP